MNKQLSSLFEKFDAMNERERLSIMSLSVIAIIVIFVELLISPLNEQYRIIDKQIVDSQAQTKQLQNQILVLNAKKNRDPDFQEKQKIKLLNEQISNLDVHLKERMHGLIEPKQMAKVLEVVLTKNTDLKLQRVQSLGAKPLSPVKVKEGEEPEELGIYRHGLQIQFTGSYLSTLKYLKALDELPWDFYWDVLELNVDKYPTSSIIITVHTLSFHERWIGV